MSRGLVMVMESILIWSILILVMMTSSLLCEIVWVMCAVLLAMERLSLFIAMIAALLFTNMFMMEPAGMSIFGVANALPFAK